MSAWQVSKWRHVQLLLHVHLVVTQNLPQRRRSLAERTCSRQALLVCPSLAVLVAFAVARSGCVAVPAPPNSAAYPAVLLALLRVMHPAMHAMPALLVFDPCMFVGIPMPIPPCIPLLGVALLIPSLVPRAPAVFLVSLHLLGHDLPPPVVVPIASLRRLEHKTTWLRHGCGAGMCFVSAALVC